MHPDNRPRLPAAARELGALVDPEMAAATDEARTNLHPVSLLCLATALRTLGQEAHLGAEICLASCNADDEALPALLTLRAWLAAIARSAQTLAEPLLDDLEAAADKATAPAVASLRARYADDLHAARRDGLHMVADDLLLPR